MKIEKFFILNLPHREDRRQSCIQQFKKCNIHNYEFVDSIHWNTLSMEFLIEATNRRYTHRTKNKEARYGNVGCGLSHLKVYDIILSRYGDNLDKAFVIFEDDFYIENPDTFMNMVERITDTPDWKFIQLGGLRNHKEDKREPYLPGLDIIKSVWNTHAYIIKNDPDFISKMILVGDEGYYGDRGTRRVIREDKVNKHKYLVTFPYEVNQTKSHSDINNVIK